MTEKVFLKKDYVTEGYLSQDGVIAYIGLAMVMGDTTSLYNKDNEYKVDYVSVNRLAYYLTGDVADSNVLKNSLAKGIAELQEHNIITIISDLSTKKSFEYVINFTDVFVDTDKVKYVVAYTDEIQKIMSCGEDMKKRIGMMIYFIALVSTFDGSNGLGEWTNKIGHMSMQYIAGQADISDRTCIRYNEVLTDIKVLFIYKSNDKIRIDDRLKQIKNCYSRYCHKGICEQYAENYEEWNGHNHTIVRTKKNKAQADKNRRLGQLYNLICAGYEYPEETVKEVYKYIVNVNKGLQDEIDRKNKAEWLSYQDKDYIEKLESQIREVSIFEQFDFLTSQSVSSDEWGEPDPMIDFSMEEILDMPTLGEVQSELPLDEGNDCLPWEDDLFDTESDLEYDIDGEKIYLTREEAEELFA